MDGQLDAERKKTARLIKENAELEKTRKKLEKENKDMKTRGPATNLSGLSEKERPQEKQTTPRSVVDKRQNS